MACGPIKGRFARVVTDMSCVVKRLLPGLVRGAHTGDKERVEEGEVGAREKERGGERQRELL
jgi:hypothetical protein